MLPSGGMHVSTCDSTPDATPQCGSKPQGPGTVAINIEARSAVNNDSEATLSTSSGCTLALKSGDLHRGWRRRGPTIAWQDVCVTVVDRATGGPRCILEFACGLAQPGRLLAVMGPSGAGKSTLMDVLAGNTVVNMQSVGGAGAASAEEGATSSLEPTESFELKQRKAAVTAAKRAASSADGMAVSGRVLVDGSPRRLREFRDMSCYVQQQEVLMASASVREALTTAALLKLPYSVSRKGVEQRVQAVLEELDLTGCADTLIGDALQGLKGISGGQKRRVSVGIELVKDPRVLFLDEPTSGLDSEAANSLMGRLRRLARMGRTVIATIHQPNSTIAAMFDDFTLLAAGRVVYGGPWCHAVDFFGGCGYRCPSFTNPAEYFIAVVQEADAVYQLADSFDQAMGKLLQPVASGSYSPTAAPSRAASTAASTPATAAAAAAAALPVPTWHAGAAGLATSSSASVQVQQQGQDGSREMQYGMRSSTCTLPGQASASSGSDVARPAGLLEEEEEEGGGEQQAQTPVWHQALVLARRYARFWVRTPGMLTTELIQYALYGVFIGSVFIRFRDVQGKDDFRRAACIWTSLTFMCFVPSTRAVTAWEEQRKLLKYELGQRLYGVTVYYLSRYMVLLPMEMAQTALFVAILYFFAGFYASAGHFFLFMLVVGMCQIIGEGIGAISSAVTRSQSAAFVLLNVVLLLCLSFVGLIIPVPVYYNWAMRSSYITYAYTCLVSHEFQHLTFVNPVTGALVPGPQAATVLGGALADALPYGLAFVVLACQLAAMEVLKLLSFHYAVWRRLL